MLYGEIAFFIGYTNKFGVGGTNRVGNSANISLVVGYETCGKIPSMKSSAQNECSTKHFVSADNMGYETNLSFPCKGTKHFSVQCMGH